MKLQFFKHLLRISVKKREKTLSKKRGFYRIIN